jgi:hypothetical protein
MEYLEGSLRLIRLNLDADPEPWKYRVSFAPYSTADPPPIRDIVGDDQVERILRQAAGLNEDTILDSVRRARGGHVVIHHVQLTDELKSVLM